MQLVIAATLLFFSACSGSALPTSQDAALVRDLRAPADLVSPSPDLVEVPPDLAISPDLVMPRDLAVPPPDLSKNNCNMGQPCGAGLLCCQSSGKCYNGACLACCM